MAKPELKVVGEIGQKETKCAECARLRRQLIYHKTYYQNQFKLLKEQLKTERNLKMIFYRALANGVNSTIEEAIRRTR